MAILQNSENTDTGRGRYIEEPTNQQSSTNIKPNNNKLNPPSSEPQQNLNNSEIQQVESQNQRNGNQSEELQSVFIATENGTVYEIKSLSDLMDLPNDWFAKIPPDAVNNIQQNTENNASDIEQAQNWQDSTTNSNEEADAMNNEQADNNAVEPPNIVSYDSQLDANPNDMDDSSRSNQSVNSPESSEPQVANNESVILNNTNVEESNLPVNQNVDTSANSAPENVSKKTSNTFSFIAGDLKDLLKNISDSTKVILIDQATAEKKDLTKY